MSEPRILALAALCWFGAVAAVPLWAPAVVAALLLAVLARREVLGIVAVGLLASTLGARAEANHVPLQRAQYDGTITLLTDPEPANFGWRAEARLRDGERVRLSAAGSSGAALSRAGAGERWAVSGRLAPAGNEPWLVARHIVGFLNVEVAAFEAGPPLWQQPSELLRGSVAAGGDRLPRNLQPLYLGLVIGDDRFQSDAQQARFRTAGLTHLLAVSGQNVAFALAVVGPGLARLRTGPRLAATVLVLLVFAMATRLEPSVVRATMTAGISAAAVASGNRTSGTRALGLAVTVLLLIDPLLTRSVGFQLSVGASLGILLIGPSLRSRLPGPLWLVSPLAITVSAQVGVGPILLTVFGPVSSITLVANLLAGWAAGAVMTLGLSVGVVAGFLPAPIAWVAQLPVRVLVWWIDAVAAWAARVPAPMVDGRVALLLAAAAVFAWRIRAGKRSLRLAAFLPLGLVLALAIPAAPQGTVELTGGGRWWPGSAQTPSVLVVEAGADRRLIEALLELRAGAIDIVILEGGGRSVSRLVANLRDVAGLGEIVAPPLHRVVGARRLLTPMVIVLADGSQLVVSPTAERLEVSIRDESQADGPTTG